MWGLNFNPTNQPKTDDGEPTKKTGTTNGRRETGKGPLIMDFLKKCIVGSGYTYNDTGRIYGIGIRKYHQNLQDMCYRNRLYTLTV